MKVYFLGHACHLVEIDGVRILTDPWLCDPIFEGHLEHDQPIEFGLSDLPAVDAIAITHGHLDHFNAPTLDRFPDKSIPIIHPPIRFTELDDNLRALGFTNLVPRPDFEPYDIGGVQIIPTPSQGVLDECAYLIRGNEGSFWDGADAPQPEELIREIRRRYGPVTVAALSHNSFDQPALLGLESHKSADHGPRAAAKSAEILAVQAAQPAASNLRWCGPDGPTTTARVIRRSPEDLRAELARDNPHTEPLDLSPGDCWTPQGVERRAIVGSGAASAVHDYLHTYLGTGETWTSNGRPSVEETFLRDLPRRTANAGEASRYVGQQVTFRVTGEDAATYNVDFNRPGDAPTTTTRAAGDEAPFALRLDCEDWKDLFQRKISWQVLLVSNRLVVERFRPGLPPDGLHFAYGMQAIFP